MNATVTVTDMATTGPLITTATVATAATTG
jgi:hypothetical protein